MRFTFLSLPGTLAKPAKKNVAIHGKLATLFIIAMSIAMLIIRNMGYLFVALGINPGHYKLLKSRKNA